MRKQQKILATQQTALASSQEALLQRFNEWQPYVNTALSYQDRNLRYTSAYMGCPITGGQLHNIRAPGGYVVEVHQFRIGPLTPAFPFVYHPCTLPLKVLAPPRLPEQYACPLQPPMQTPQYPQRPPAQNYKFYERKPKDPRPPPPGTS